MRNLRILAALALATGAGVATAAEVSSTVTLTNDYDFRGITQTNEDPALQASIDIATEPGWYVGAWASNVDFPGYDGSVELDLYTGFSGETEGGLGWDAGIIWYTYPDSNNNELPDFPEIYGSLSIGPFKGKVWYSNDFGGTDEDSIYGEGNLTFEVGGGVSLLAHAGYSFGDAIDTLYGDSYIDYAAGVGYSLGGFDLALKYVGQTVDDEVAEAADLDDSRVVFTIARTFGWGG